MTDETPMPSAAAAAQAAPRRVFGRRRRANVAGGRPHAHRVLVSGDEEARLGALAKAAGVTVPRLLVEATLAGSAETATARRDAIVELFAVRRLLAAVSNNVNQIARHANAGEDFPADAAALLGAVRRLVVRIDGVVEQLAKPEQGVSRR